MPPPATRSIGSISNTMPPPLILPPRPCSPFVPTSAVMPPYMLLCHRHLTDALPRHSYALTVCCPSATQADYPPPSGPPSGPGPLPLHAAPYMRASISDSEGTVCICPAFLQTALHPGALGKLGWISLPCRCRYWVSSLSMAGFAILNHPLAGPVALVSPILFQFGVAGAPLASRTPTYSTIFLLVGQRKNDSICNFLKR
jgi:hypothetical protein